MAYHREAARRVYNSVAACSVRENRLPSFGQKLKREREKRAITLEQISSSTKIGTRMLQALEDENFDHLPGGIFNKGFVRAYARHVGLDEDQAVADYLEASGQNAPPKADPATEAATAEDDSSETIRSWRIPWGWLAGGLLVVALALTLWNRRQHKDVHPQLPAPSDSAKPAGSEAENPNAKSGISTAPSGVSNAVPSPPPAKAASPISRPASSNVSNVSAPVSTVPTAAVAGEFTLVILAREDSWVSIIADGKAFEETLFADNQRTIHARNEVVIKSGNTGGLDFVFNGKKLPSQGDYGEVKTLTFDPSGLLSKSPAPTPIR
jgi:cytoskeleton protein RodZ